jgi:starch-binding outer membrane protein, SusD/RagB family
MKTKYFIIPLLAGSLLTTGCVDTFLNLDPLDSQTEAVYFKTLAEFQAAANSLHSNIFAFASSETKYLNSTTVTANNCYAINFDWGTDLSGVSQDDMNGTAVAGTTDVYWQQSYKWLRACNSVIEKGKEYSDTSEIKVPVGQAYFFRAWNHFFLLKRFGGVPIANTTTTLDDDIVWGKRASRYEVVKQILDDLDVAIEKLASYKSSTSGNDGHVTLGAAQALKARVCLYEATFEKYNSANLTTIDGDGTTSGAGTTKPDNYPSITEMLTEAKAQAKNVIDSGEYGLFLSVESVSGVTDPDRYAHSSYYYLFNLEGSTSNPAGVDKTSNKESIFRTCYDATYRPTKTNITHTWPAGMTRKLNDMYLCTDGLPVHLSPLFGGYEKMNAEYENRDYRFTCCQLPAFSTAWGWGMYGSGADYTLNPDSLTWDASTKGTYSTYKLKTDLYLSIPSYKGEAGGGSRKFRTELASVKTAGDEGMDFMHIRLAEVYLIYAEATCELGGGSITADDAGSITDADLDYSINIVRARGGVAPLNAALIAKANALADAKGYGHLTLLGEIRRERACELYGEGQRFADLTRWGIAVAEMANQNTCGTYLQVDGVDTEITKQISPVDGTACYQASAYVGLMNTDNITYSYAGLTPTLPGCAIAITKANRKFALKNYLQPIPTDQITLNPELLQNPSW